MRSGVLIALLVAGGLATGVLGASFTAPVIREYRAAYPSVRDAGYPADQDLAPVPSLPDYSTLPQDYSGETWLDQSFAAPEIPDSPFGSSEWDNGAYSEYGPSHPKEWDRDVDEAYSYEDAYPYADDYREQEDRDAALQDLRSSSREPSPPRDAAADAAARAGSVVQDVIEAERSY